MNATRTAIAAGIGLFIAALTRSADVAFAALAVLIVSLLTVLVTRRLFTNLEFSRTLSRAVVPWGGDVEVTISVENRKWLPVVWLQVNDDWPTAVQPIGFTLKPSHKPATERLANVLSIGWFQRVRRHYVGRCLMRGVHSFGPAVLEAGDPLGFAEVFAHPTDQRRLIVLPKVLIVDGLDSLLGTPLVATPAQTSFARDPANLIGVRDYRPDDSFRAINWRATARRQIVQVNEFEPSAAARAVILLNMRIYEFAWQGIDPVITELLCVVAASLATALSDSGFAVGLRTNGLVQGSWQAPSVEPAPGSLFEVLDTLARVVTFPPPVFDSLLRDEAGATSEAGERLIITAALDSNLAVLIDRLATEHPVRVIFIGDEPSPAATWPLVRIPPAFDWQHSDVLTLA
jgi:uncharacterized protein (DUF58 family)